jgi:hypothetical protein
MQQEEAKLSQEIAALIDETEQINKSEDKQYGKNKRGDEIPKDLQRKEDRLKKIRKAKAALEERAAKEKKKKFDNQNTSRFLSVSPRF